jgi:hypothetical protein
MTLATFLKRLEDGKANNLIYSIDGKEGLLCVWKDKDDLILTWEECSPGEQYDESTYTRDSRYVFADCAKLQEFLATNKLEIEMFKP